MLRSVVGHVGGHLRRSAMECVNFALNREVVFTVVGAANRRWRFVESVFLVYPANDAYALNYCYPRRLRKNRWTPWPTGILHQNGRWTLMVAVSASEEHLLQEANHGHLVQIVAQVDHLRERIGASHRSFAGILPGLLHTRGVLSSRSENSPTAQVIHQSIELLRRERPELSDVVILGSLGFVGRQVMGLLDGDPHVWGIDKGEGEWPHDPAGGILLVNIADQGAINGFLHRLRPGAVVLNEVYPPPDRRCRDALAAAGVDLFHIVGVEATAFPPFPQAYKGAIPCCAAWPAQDTRVVLRRL